jgi:hypothetical protein
VRHAHADCYVNATSQSDADGDLHRYSNAYGDRHNYTNCHIATSNTHIYSNTETDADAEICSNAKASSDSATAPVTFANEREMHRSTRLV